MADEVKVPLAGKQSKKAVVLVAVGAGAFVIFMYMRRKKPTASTPADTSATDTTSMAGIDPATGAPYGSYGGTGGYSGTAGYPAYGTSAVTGTSAITTNAEWAQQAESVVPPLINSPTAQSDVASAVGRFLSGLPLTADQAAIIQVCESELGPPPVGSFSIIPEASTTPPGSGTPSTIPVPNVIGIAAGAAHNKIVDAGLHPTAPPGQTKNMKVSRTIPPAGTQVAKGSDVQILTHGYV